MRKLIKSCRGITLIEMMIGVVIVGIAATMAVPRFQMAMDKVQFRSITRDVVSKIRMARSQAISEKNRYGVYFNYANSTTTYFEDVDGGDVTMFEEGWDNVIKVDTLGDPGGTYLEYVVTNLTNDAVIFSPNGSASTGGSVFTVIMTENITGIAEINILASTGRVKSEQYVW